MRVSRDIVVQSHLVAQESSIVVVVVEIAHVWQVGLAPGRCHLAVKSFKVPDALSPEKDTAQLVKQGIV